MSRVIAGMSSWNVGKRRRSVVRSARTEPTASSISSYMCSNCTVDKETSSLILFRTVRDHYCSAEGMLQTMIHSELEERRQFSCEKCGKGYLHFRNLHRHRRHECGKLPSFGCTVCSYRAFQKVSNRPRPPQLVASSTALHAATPTCTRRVSGGI
ncbi:uncharacterized protein LOC124356160 isoform X2 [Homalodisca vitripennis]|uniref:uncharacterized protein LOC124356160 isoform X2 n=1 Tax=Homalodisca vitripennis TaxID=197043 RepID=UPI001EECA8BA|nr:uncharacterized protein LOC124356160 isoform X2 [Homalodisca vitripennis]